MTIKLTRLDLDYILTQIQMAEAGQVPINPLLSSRAARGRRTTRARILRSVRPATSA